ncbi:hypothetical protein DND58_08260 [Pseudomonas syringae pv. pisi]|nr:hypothetical protein DND62_10330 [Pseudomonas syringae pv. pisi]PYD32294.1 hypothetical protein DND58_08260 [Pseudomonas syringae pv. pisi]RMV01199.1 hypothetical protein ALP20_200096 [Pseudomonas coronafaciens pv. coronafaciens]
MNHETSDPLKAIPLPILNTPSIAREAGNVGCSLAEVRQAMAHDWGVHVDAYLVRGARVGDRYAATAYFVWGGRMCDVPPCEQSFETPAGSSKRLFGGMTVATLGPSGFHPHACALRLLSSIASSLSLGSLQQQVS